MINKEDFLISIKKSNSLNILRDINKKISERKFHEFTHILYDIRTYLGNKPINYLEIGSYIGSSASLLLSHSYPTNVYCVDPLNLPKKHFKGKTSQEETLKKNLEMFKNKNIYKILKNYSTDESLLNEIKDLELDILFIDGCHKYEYVLKDWNNYEPKVKSGGFIIFDDYLDPAYINDVKKCVDDICLKLDKSKYQIIGSIPDLQGINSKYIKDFSNEFIIYKI